MVGFLLVRGGVHIVVYARALEKLTGADIGKLCPSQTFPIKSSRRPLSTKKKVCTVLCIAGVQKTIVNWIKFGTARIPKMVRNS